MTRIIAAEDDPEVRRMLALALSNDYEIVTAADGAEALEILGGAPADVVVLDVAMPNVDGLEATQRIRHDPELESLPVILLTALNSDTDYLRGFRSGADAYLTKPFLPDDLIMTIERLRMMSPEQRKQARDDERATTEFLVQLDRRFEPPS